MFLLKNKDVTLKRLYVWGWRSSEIQMVGAPVLTFFIVCGTRVEKLVLWLPCLNFLFFFSSSSICFFSLGCNFVYPMSLGYCLLDVFLLCSIYFVYF